MKHPINVLDNKGLSSFEILLSTVIFSLISIVLVSTFLTSQMVWSDSIINVKLEEAMSQPMQQMVKKIKEADPSSPTGVTISNSNGTISFAIPQTYDSSQITSWTAVTYAYDSSAKTITETTAASSNVIGRNISSCSFTQSGNAILISLSVNSVTSMGKTLTSSLSSRAAMRN